MKKQSAPGKIGTIGELARKLNEDPGDRASLSSAAELIANGKGVMLLKALLHPRWDELDENVATKEVEAIEATNHLLERMMDASPGVAGYLMLKLYRFAGRHRLQHICDSIVLWIEDYASEDLADSLMLIASEGSGLHRKRYEAWALRIREASKRPKPQAEEVKHYRRPPPLPQPNHVDFLEEVVSEERVRAYVLALADNRRKDLASRFIFHQHVYDAVAATDEQAIVRAYLTFLGYPPEEREKRSSVSHHEHLAELDVEVAYTLMKDALRRHLGGAEEPATEAEVRGFVQCMREATEAWAILAFTNLETPPVREGGLLAVSHHGVVADLDKDAGVILVGEQDIAMIWFFDGAIHSRPREAPPP